MQREEVKKNSYPELKPARTIFSRTPDRSAGAGRSQGFKNYHTFTFYLQCAVMLFSKEQF